MRTGDAIRRVSLILLGLVLAVTAVLILSAVLFITIRVMVRYERIIDGIARLHVTASAHKRRVRKRVNRYLALL